MTGAFTPGLLARLPQPPRKVAIVRALRIGDFLLATPAFRALRAALLDAEITLIGLPFVRELVERSTQLDRFVEFPGFPGLAEQFFDARRALDFFARMQAERFDLAIQMHGSGVYANPFTLMLGARVTAGYVRPGDGPGRLDAALPMPEALHEVHKALALTSFLGAPPQGEDTEFSLWPQDRATAAALLMEARPPLLGLHAAARDRTKRWALERFAEVGAVLLRRLGGTVVLIGGAEERMLAASLQSTLGKHCLNLVGCTSLPALGAVIERLDVLVTNDSGPLHVASALGTPTVTIFGSTDPARWAPLERDRHRVLLHPVPCRPCDHVECPIGYVCLQAVSVKEVVDAACGLAHKEKPCCPSVT